MYGTWSGTSIGALVVGIALVIALAFWAAPLIAVIVALIALPLFIYGMVVRRRKEAAEDPAGGAEPEPADPVTPEGKPTSPTGSRSRGAPASGEGQR